MHKITVVQTDSYIMIAVVKWYAHVHAYCTCMLWVPLPCTHAFKDTHAHTDKHVSMQVHTHKPIDTPTAGFTGAVQKFQK